jgi:hypothetical protein
MTEAELKRSHRILAPGLLRLVAILAVLAVSACGGTAFRTYYPQGLDPAVTRGWTVGNVKVDVPRQLSVSEERTYLPRADIVWREDPPGDRHAQVARIMSDAIRTGSASLHGKRRVVIEARMTRFHAMTFEAEALSIKAGVHDVEFDIRILDARTGTVLVPTTHIEASFPARTGAEMAMARARGDSQKKQIRRHVAATIAGWLGTGQDARTSFTRIGG